MRSKIKYSVKDSKNTSPIKIGIELVKKIKLATRKRGVIYVRLYTVGDLMSKELRCAFYQAIADDKSIVLQ